MALSATISLSLSTVQINQPTVATVTISNSGASNVNLINCRPTAVKTGASIALDKTPFAAGTTVPGGNAGSTSVPASGSLVITYPYNFFEPSNPTYDCGCILTTSDGSVFSPTVATCTVNQLNFQDAT